MKVILFGATGMIGQGVLRECLASPDVETVLAVGRRATDPRHPKLRDLVASDLFDLTPIESDLAGFEACFFCLGVSSAGMSEADYRRVTLDLTLSVARTLARLNPQMTFVYVSGAGTGGRSMWARVKEETETALLRLPLKAVLFRPAFVHPGHGIVSRTRMYRVFYTLLGPLYPLLKAVSPRLITTTERVGRAMLHVARYGAPGAVVENAAINELAAAGAPESPPAES